jgi:hypothetical protein
MDVTTHRLLRTFLHRSHVTSRLRCSLRPTEPIRAAIATSTEGRETACPLSAGRWGVAGNMQSAILHMKQEERSSEAVPAKGTFGEGGGHVLADDWRRVRTSRNKQSSFRNPGAQHAPVG